LFLISASCNTQAEFGCFTRRPGNLWYCLGIWAGEWQDKVSGESRGFGFVEMPNKEEADKAISGLNGKDLKGRPLTVNPLRGIPGTGVLGGIAIPRSGDRRSMAGESRIPRT
jgi:hypothetical protein